MAADWEPREKKQVSENQPQEPVLQSLGLKLLGPLGLCFAPANHVQVINRLGIYHAALGPQFFWINRMVESLGPQVFIGNRSRVFVMQNLPARDSLQLGLKIWIAFTFDPRRTIPEIATPLSQLTPDLMLGLVEGHARHTLLRLVGEYAAEEVCRGGAVFQTIEQGMKTGLEGRLARLGIKVGDVRVTEVTPPPLLTARLEQTAQRGYNIQSMQEYHPSQVAQALAVELVERLSAQQAEEQYVNIGDLLGSYLRGAAVPAPPEPRTITSASTPSVEEPSKTGGKEQNNNRRGPTSRSRF
ncbi:MAG: SPFH domain-containing protein [Anaerolineae bacterium]